MFVVTEYETVVSILYDGTETYKSTNTRTFKFEKIDSAHRFVDGILKLERNYAKANENIVDVTLSKLDTFISYSRLQFNKYSTSYQETWFTII